MEAILQLISAIFSGNPSGKTSQTKNTNKIVKIFNIILLSILIIFIIIGVFYLIFENHKPIIYKPSNTSKPSKLSNLS